MFPLSDDNPRYGKVPLLTYLLIGACVLVHFYQMSLPPQAGQLLVMQYGVVPELLLGDGYAAGLPSQPYGAWGAVISSMFLHGDLMHLGGNMLYLWIFADNVEVAFGKLKFIVFYVLTGVAAALTQAGLNPDSTIPMIGASGAISGVLGAYMLMYPKARVLVLAPFMGLMRIPAFIVLGMWFALQFFGGLGAPADEGGVAFWAHVGGFVAGMLLLPVMRLGGPPPEAFISRETRQDDAGHEARIKKARRKGPWG